MKIDKRIVILCLMLGIFLLAGCGGGSGGSSAGAADANSSGSAVRSCIVNTIYTDGSPSISMCTEHVPENGCLLLESNDKKSTSNAFLMESNCVGLGFSADSKAELPGQPAGRYYKTGVFIKPLS